MPSTQRGGGTYLELSDREALSKTRPWPIDEGQQVPVSLHLFRPSRNALVLRPPFRPEFLGIRTPQRRRSIHG